MPRLLAVLLIMILLPSCDSSEEVTSELFSVRMETPDGTPVEGLEVAVHYPLGGERRGGTINSDGMSFAQLSSPYPNPFTSSALVSFRLEETARVNLDVLDLEHREVDSLVEDDFAAGVTNSVLIAADSLPSPGVYLLRLQSEADGEASSDTSYAVYAANFDPSVRGVTFTVGVTDGQGRVATSNQSFFPVLYDLPPVDYRTPENVLLGTLQFGRTIDIVVSEGAREERYVRVIQDGSNDFTLTWDPE